MIGKLLGRILTVIPVVLVQLFWLILLSKWLAPYAAVLNFILSILSFLFVLYIITKQDEGTYKILWLLVILIAPIPGALLYAVFGNKRTAGPLRRRLERSAKALPSMEDGGEALEALAHAEPRLSQTFRWMEKTTGYPLRFNTGATYYPIGEELYAAMLRELEKAETFIFAEYFIIARGEMWDTMVEIMARKAAAGVDVRVMYDDLGCMLTLPAHYKRVLEEKGIRCCVFNPFVPVLSSRLNNRDHRKICVIDGHTGFTGGINLADEYINAYKKHGHWKDSAVLLRGDAVWSLTLMFLSLWDYMCGSREDYALYHPRRYLPEPVPSDGIVQPYTDSPLDDEAVGETVYLNLINKADRYVYITTPYLIISNEMITALTTAAKSGLDVRIITPHIADKWYVHAVTRAYYEVLIEAGVRIFEYTPGFIHAKTFTVDDEYGVVGTINLDFRSLYLHFECAAWMYRCSCIPVMREDFLRTQQVSQEVTLEECRGVNLVTRVVRSVLRVFAPLM